MLPIILSYDIIVLKGVSMKNKIKKDCKCREIEQHDNNQSNNKKKQIQNKFPEISTKINTSMTDSMVDNGFNSLDEKIYKYPNIERWQFGIDNDRLLNLVLSGKKTATSCLYNKNEDIAKVGDLSIITTSNGKDACIIQTEEVIILPFYKMTWELAKLEGENENLEDWFKIHTTFFKTRNKNFNENTLIVFEKFKLVKKF